MHLLPLALALLACSGGSSGDGGDSGDSGSDTATGDSGDTGETEDTTPPPWEPEAGSYQLTMGKTLKDTCAVPEQGGKLPTSSQIEVAVAEDKSSVTMTIPDDQGGKPLIVVCPRTEYAFHCDLADVADSETAAQYGLEATITLTIDQEGLFSDETHFDGSYTWLTDCLGPDCSTVEWAIGDGFSFPCGGTSLYSAVHL